MLCELCNLPGDPDAPHTHVVEREDGLYLCGPCHASSEPKGSGTLHCSTCGVSKPVEGEWDEYVTWCNECVAQDKHVPVASEPIQAEPEFSPEPCDAYEDGEWCEVPVFTGYTSCPFHLAL